MDFDREALTQIRSAIQIDSPSDHEDVLRRSALAAAVGIATVIEGVAEDAAGTSWLDTDSRSHSLLVNGGQLIHVVVAGDVVLTATNYSAAIDTLRAEDHHQVGQFVTDGCRVMQWHVTLRDGSVISLRASNGPHADELAEFVRLHLMPPSTP